MIPWLAESFGASLPIALASLPILDETILFLVCAGLVSLLAKRFRVPYTIGLVLMGLVVGFIRQYGGLFQGEGHFELTDRVILLVFLPPLLFEGAMNIEAAKLWRNKGVILALAFIGTLGSVLIIAAASKVFFGWEWQYALLLGVIISPTDPVSVLAIFREQGVPKRLSVLVEGESLLNDGVSIVLYLLLLAGITAGWDTVGPGEAMLTLAQMVLGGLAIGSILGVASNWLLAQIDDHLVEVLISIVLAYGSYLLAEHLHCSGVIAVVFAALLFGNVGRRSSMSPTTLLTINLSWEVFAFLANSLVFLAMGFAVELDLLFSKAGWIVLLFLVMLVARALLTYGIGGIDLWRRRAYPVSWLHVLNWGGLKGTIPVALALGLTFSVPEDERDRLQTLTFGVVLLSLLVQGLSIQTLLARLGLNSSSPARDAWEASHARSIALEAALDELATIERLGEWPAERCARLREDLTAARDGADRAHDAVMAKHPELAEMRDREIFKQLLHRQRSALDESARRGGLGEHALREARSEIDALLAAGAPVAHPGGRPPTDLEAP